MRGLAATGRITPDAARWRRAARRPVALIGAVAIVASGCGGGDGAANSVSGRMLLVGNATSPIVDALRSSLAADRYTGVENPASYRLVVYDGNTVGGAELAADALVDRGLAAGASVLVVNARPEHKQALDAPGRAGAVVGGNSYGYLLTPFTQAGGRRAMHITHIRDGDYDLRSTHVADKNIGLLTGNVQTLTKHQELTPTLVNAFVDLAKRRIVGDAGDHGVADSLPSDICWFSQVVTEVFTESGKDLPNNSGSPSSDTPGCNNDCACPTPTPGVTVQQPTQTLNYTFRVFLDNGDPDQNKWFQWAMVEVSGQMSPASLIEDCRDCTRSDPNYFGFGWLQSKIEVDVAPVNANGGGGTNLATWSSSPNAPLNGAYDSTSQFDITYTTKAHVANQVYSWSETSPPSPLALGDWTVTEPGGVAINEFFWQWRQTEPFDNDTDSYRCAFSTIRGGLLDYRINQPIPALSTGQFPLTAQGVWNTLPGVVVNQPIAIDYRAVRTFVLLQADRQAEGIYDRDWWISTVDPGPTEVAVAFDRASVGQCTPRGAGQEDYYE